jgi:hypothetical protein
LWIWWPFKHQMIDSSKFNMSLYETDTQWACIYWKSLSRGYLKTVHQTSHFDLKFSQIKPLLWIWWPFKHRMIDASKFNMALYETATQWACIYWKSLSRGYSNTLHQTSHFDPKFSRIKPLLWIWWLFKQQMIENHQNASKFNMSLYEAATQWACFY